MHPILPLLAMVPPLTQHLSPLEAVAQQSPYFRLLRDHGAATSQALEWIEGNDRVNKLSMCILSQA